MTLGLLGVPGQPGGCSENLSFFSYFVFFRGLVTLGLLGEFLEGLGIALRILVFLVILVYFQKHLKKLKFHANCV